MKISKILLFALITLTVTSTTNVQAHTQAQKIQANKKLLRNIDEAPEKELSKEAQLIKKQSEEIVKRILETKPTTWYGDLLGRDLVAGIVAGIAAYAIYNVVEGKKRNELKGLYSTEKDQFKDKLEAIKASHHNDPVAYLSDFIPALTAFEQNPDVQAYKEHIGHKYYYAALIFPILRILFDKFIRKTEKIDDDLNALISQKDASLEGLLAADFDINNLEEKVMTLGTKAEWFRWIVRALIIVNIMYDINKHTPSDNVAFGITSNAVAVSLCFYALVMQSATWKKYERTKKLQVLKELLSKKKKPKKKKKQHREDDDEETPEFEYD